MTTLDTGPSTAPAGAGVRDYWAILRQYMRPEARRVAVLALMLLVGIGLQLVNPQLVRRFLDTVEEGGSLQELLLTAAAFTGVAIVAQIVRLGAVYVGEIVAWTTTNELRSDLALHCLRLDMSFHKRHKPGELIERVDGDVNLLANFLSQLVIQLVSNILLIAGVLVLLWLLDWRVGATITVIAIAGVIVLSLLNKRVVPLWQALREVAAELFGHLEEWLGGTEEIQTNAAAPYVMGRLYPVMRRRWLRMQRAMRMNIFIMSLPILVPALAYIAAYLWGAALYKEGVLTIGTVYVIFYYVDVIKGPLWVIQRQVQDLQTAAASMNRVAALLGEHSTLREGTVAALPEGPLGLRFDHVTFHYDDDMDKPVLRDVDFDLAPGRVLGLLGRTGSGKTTVIRLLYRLYDPTAGAIFLRGVAGPPLDLRRLKQSAVRERVGLVTQDVQLFTASVRDNLTVFDDSVDDARITAALGRLGLGEWLESMPDGLDTRLTADQRLSAGEAQLLAMARVFIRDVSLVVLDEASSRLDPATERLIDHAIEALLADRTAIIIAHHLRTVDRADEIMILADGKIVEHGEREALASDPASRFSALRRAGLGDLEG